MSTEQKITNEEVKPTPSPANYNPFMQQRIYPDLGI